MAKTIEQLKAQGAEIKNATVVGENTATRVGTLFTDIVEHVEQYEAGQTADTEANAVAISNEAQARAKADEGLNSAIIAEKNRAEAVEEAIIFDVSSHNDGAVFESLQALLSSSNLSKLIPTSVRHGGMSIRFIQGSEQSSDNKYVQYRLMADTFNTTVTNWQGVDDEPKQNSQNLVESGGVFKIVLDAQSAQTYINEYDHSIILKRQLGYLFSDGTIGFFNNYGRTQPIKVSAGDILEFFTGCWAAGGGAAEHVLFDALGNRLSSFADESNPYTITNPSASYVVFSIYDVNDRQYFVKLHRNGNRNTKINQVEQQITLINNDVISLNNDVISINNELSVFNYNTPISVDHINYGYYNNDGTFVEEGSVWKCMGYAVTKGQNIRIMGVVNGPENTNYGAIIFASTNGGNGTVIVDTSHVGEQIDLHLTAPENGYYYYWDYDGTYNVYTEIREGNKINYVASSIPTKNIAILGDSIMMLMGAYAGQNEVTFEDENGNAYQYSELTNINGHLFAPGSVPVDVVNSKQVGLDSMTWNALKSKLGVSRLYNFGLGGAMLQEREVITSYPYNDGTIPTCSLANEVRWLIRRYDTGAIEKPDCILIWLGTNSVGSSIGNYNEIVALTYDELAADAHYSDRCTVYGGLRWSIETLYKKFNDVNIIFATPIQAGSQTGRTYESLSSIGEAIKKMAHRYSCLVCDALNEIGIPDILSSVYMADGLHPNDKGKAVLTNYIAKKINANYIDK